MRGELGRTLTHAFDEIWERFNENDLAQRTTLFTLGIERVARATELAGLA